MLPDRTNLFLDLLTSNKHSTTQTLFDIGIFLFSLRMVEYKEGLFLAFNFPVFYFHLFLVHREWEGAWAEDVVTDEVIGNNLGWLTNVIKNPLAPKMLLFVPDAGSMTTPGCVSSCWTTT